MKFKSICLLLAFLAAGTVQSQEMTVRDIGVIGLFSHDVFTWDHRQSVNTENGIVDLSTIFDYQNGSRWELGGNPKNSENAPVYTVTMELVDFYKSQLAQGNSSDARKETVKLFIGWILDSYHRLAGEVFALEGLKSQVNNTEQAVLRSMHDILPGYINLYREGRVNRFKVTDPHTTKTKLNERELSQAVRPFDGDYDREYLDIDIIFTRINLKEIDSKFIETFSPFRQGPMLAELKAYGEKQISFGEISFSHHVSELLAKALCSEKSEWLPYRKCVSGAGGE